MVGWLSVQNGWFKKILSESEVALQLCACYLNLQFFLHFGINLHCVQSTYRAPLQFYSQNTPERAEPDAGKLTAVPGLPLLLVCKAKHLQNPVCCLQTQCSDTNSNGDDLLSTYYVPSTAVNTNSTNPTSTLEGKFLDQLKRRP